MSKRAPLVDDTVRLAVDIPALWLHRGDTGVIRSTWFAPTTAYEVEFPDQQGGGRTRALVPEEEVELQEAASAPAGAA